MNHPNFQTGRALAGRPLWPAIAVAITVAGAMLPATPGWAYDLIDAYRDAVANDASYQAQVLQQEAVRQRLPEARSFLLPQVSANARQTKVDEKLLAPGAPFVVQGTADYDTHGYGISLRQALFNGAAFSGYKRAKLEVELADLETEIVRQSLLRRTAEVYVAVLQANDNANLTRANEEAAGQQHQEVKNRYEVGLATRAEYQDALARWQIAIADNITGQNALRDALRALQRLTGASPAELDGLGADPKLDDIAELYDLQAWLESVKLHNLNILKEEINVGIAERNVAIEKSGHYPSLDLVVDYGADIADGSISGTASRRSATNASVVLDIPIFEGGRVSARTRAARYSLQASEQQLENTRRIVLQDAQALYDTSASQKQTVDALANAVEASVLAFEAKREGYEAGLETNRNVLDAQRDLFRTALELNRARYDSLVQRLRMEESIGALDENDLASINQLFTTPISDQLQLRLNTP